jgi:hypothetical protein
MSDIKLSIPPPLRNKDSFIKADLSTHNVNNINKEPIPINNSNLPTVEFSPNNNDRRIPSVALPMSEISSPFSDSKIHGSSPTTSLPDRTPSHAISPPEIKKPITVERVAWNNKSPSPRAVSIRSPPKIEHSIPKIPTLKVKPIESLQSESPRINNIGAGAGIHSVPVQRNNILHNNAPAKPERPNYASMNDEEQKNMKKIFMSKYLTIKTSYPNWKIPLPEDSWDLDYTHDLFESLVKQIVISMNCDQYRAYLIVMFLGVEIFCIKVLGLDMSGYTLAQVESMNRYDQLLTELGEKYYIQGPSSWPLEARLIIVAGVNAIFFLIVRYLCKWAGNESFAPSIQSVLNQLLGGGSQTSTAQCTDENGLPNLPQNTVPKPSASSTNSGFDIGSLLNTVTNLVNGNGGGSDLASNLAQVGNMFTKNMANNNNNNNSSNTNTNSDDNKKPTKKRPVWNN